MQFCSQLDEYSWGSEDFRLADLGYKDSLVREGWLAGNSIGEIMDTYIDRVVGDNVYEYYGRQFPVGVKNIHVKGKMPLQVHPDDGIGVERYDLLGKDKYWYVTRVGKDAKVLLGFRKDTDAGEVYSKCLDGTVDDIMNIIAPHAGQMLRIAPGTPHAAEGDMDIIEISEASPLDFCMCGWGEPVSEEQFDTTLSMVDALEFINYGKYAESTTEPAFTSRKMELSDPLHIYSEAEGAFMVYTCVKGSASIQIRVLGQQVDYPMQTGDTILIPSECIDYYLIPTADASVVLETTVERNDADPYIDLTKEPVIPGEDYEEDNETI